VQFRTWSVEIADNGGHAGLVAHGSGKVDGLLWVILGEAVKIIVSLFCRRQLSWAAITS
jgi:hypothetical protein